MLVLPLKLYKLTSRLGRPSSAMVVVLWLRSKLNIGSNES